MSNQNSASTIEFGGNEPIDDMVEELKMQLPNYMQGFLLDISKFNEMYRMPEVEYRPEAFMERIRQFESILKEECGEIVELATCVPAHMGEFRVALSDLLGDLIVYCASEAKRWGIPIDRVLKIIMESNFSKLNPDGSATFDERGKLMKGPNYWKPEAKIAEMLIGMGDMK